MITFIGFIMWRLILLAVTICISILAVSALIVCVFWLYDNHFEKGEKENDTYGFEQNGTRDK